MKVKSVEIMNSNTMMKIEERLVYNYGSILT